MLKHIDTSRGDSDIGLNYTKSRRKFKLIASNDFDITGPCLVFGPVYLGFGRTPCRRIALFLALGFGFTVRAKSVADH